MYKEAGIAKEIPSAERIRELLKVNTCQITTDSSGRIIFLDVGRELAASEKALLEALLGKTLERA